MGIIADILKSVSKPARDIGEIGRLLAVTRSADPNINKDLDTLEKRLEAQRRVQEYKPLLQSQEEQLGMFLNPAGTTLRNAATVGAMIAPVGIAGSIGSRAGAGALGGALGSYGMTPITENADLGKILGGAGLGALLGGTIGAVEKGIAGKAARSGQSGLTKLGKKMEKGATGIKTPKTPLGEEMSLQTFDDVSRITSKYRANPDVSGIGKAYQGLSNDLTKSLRASKATANIDDIALSAAQKLSDELGIVDDKALRLIDSTVKRSGQTGVLNAQGLANLKRATQPAALKAVQIMDRGGNVTPSMYAQYAVNSIADDILKSSLDDAGRAIYQDMAILHSVAPDIITKADKAGHITVANIKIPTLGIPQRVQATTGRALQSIGNIQAPQVSQKVLSNLGNAGIYGTRLGQAIGYEQPEQQPEQQTIQQQLPSGIDSQGVNALNLMLAQEVLNGNISATEANAVLSLLGMSQDKDLTANQSKAIALQRSLDTLKSAWEGAGAGTKFAETLGINIGSKTRMLDQAKRAVAEDLGRLQSQGAINVAEREEFDRMMPNSWDSPEVVQQKFQAIQNRIDSYKQSPMLY